MYFLQFIQKLSDSVFFFKPIERHVIFQHEKKCYEVFPPNSDSVCGARGVGGRRGKGGGV